MAITISKNGAGQLTTKRGNRVFLHEKPKGMSRLRFGIVCNYFDACAKKIEPKFSFDTSIKELYYQFYDRLFYYYGAPSPAFGYIKAKDVLINPVGDLHSRRYFITDKGRKRLEDLKMLKANRIKKLKQDERKRLKSCSSAD